jgi:hypothetical protein
MADGWVCPTLPPRGRVTFCWSSGTTKVSGRGRSWIVSSRDPVSHSIVPIAAGPDAAIKKIYEVSLGNFSIADGANVTKKLVYDLMPLLASLNGDIYEKIEGLCATAAGKVRVFVCGCLWMGP